MRTLSSRGTCRQEVFPVLSRRQRKVAHLLSRLALWVVLRVLLLQVEVLVVNTGQHCRFYYNGWLSKDESPYKLEVTWLHAPCPWRSSQHHAAAWRVQSRRF